MISVPDAGIFPRMPGTRARVTNCSITCVGNPLGYVGKAFCRTIPAISQCPVVVSLPFDRSVHFPYEQNGDLTAGILASGRILPSPIFSRFGSLTSLDARM